MAFAELNSKFLQPSDDLKKKRHGDYFVHYLFNCETREHKLKLQFISV